VLSKTNFKGIDCRKSLLNGEFRAYRFRSFVPVHHYNRVLIFETSCAEKVAWKQWEAWGGCLYGAVFFTCCRNLVSAFVWKTKLFMWGKSWRIFFWRSKGESKFRWFLTQALNSEDWTKRKNHSHMWQRSMHVSG